MELSFITTLNGIVWWQLWPKRPTTERAHLENWLAGCMAFETGCTFSPTIRNPKSGAVGLIQWTGVGAKASGTTQDALAKMSATQQLSFVGDYFEPYARGIHTFSDMYMAILWPSAIGKPEDYPIMSAGELAYKQNRGLDTNKDREITKGEAAARARAVYNEGMLERNSIEVWSE